MPTMNESRWTSYPNFTESEFKCPCGCQSKPMDEGLISILQAIRTELGKPVKVTSGYRCQKYNDSLKGSIKTSDHIQGKSADIYIAGITDTPTGRGIVMGMARELPHFKYAYCDGLYFSKEKTTIYAASWMGNAVHISVE